MNKHVPRPVLDHGEVRLIDQMGDDLSIVRNARVSFGKQNKTGLDPEADIKLLKYLWKNKHTTPFESVVFSFYVKAPIFIFRQWHRHRTQSYNEASARYKQLPNEFYIPTAENIGRQSGSNKQGRSFESDTDLPTRIQERQLFKDHCEASYKLYEQLISREWPRELARAVLPVNIYSEMVTTVNLLNLLKFLTLRVDEHAQFEIREYAEAIIDILDVCVPETMNAWRTFK